MRRYVAALVFFLLIPTLAYAEPECKGRENIVFDQVTKGCLLQINMGAVTRTVTRETVRKSSRDAVVIHVAIFGAFTEKFRLQNTRMRQVCERFKQNAVKSEEVGNFNKVIVVMHWVRLAPGQAPRPVGSKGPSVQQSGFMNKNCRGVRRFG